MAKGEAYKAEIEKLKIKFLEYYRELPVTTLAAASIGRSDDTIGNWRKEDAEFSEQIDQARANWAMKNAKGVKSKEWLLERVLRNQFSPRQEITGKDGKDLPTPILKINTDVLRDDSNKENKPIIKTT